MAKITVATFNAENLFIRFKFTDKISPDAIQNAVKNGFIKDKKLFFFIFEKERELTAKAIKETGADIIALQEIENLDTLKSFQSKFLKRYPYQYLLDANDPRYIDVAVLSKFEAKYLRTHQFDKSGKSKIFSRDCLEIGFEFKGVPLTLFVNHFKSMLGGREQTMARRKKQAKRVVEIIKEKFGDKPGNENFIVMGDFNDYLPSPGLAPLANQKWLVDVIAEKLPAEEKWTHWYSGDKTVSQLDYLLLSKHLAENNPDSVPVIVRKGLAMNCKQYMGPRFAGVKAYRPSASDHCPAAITLNVQ